MALQLGQIAPDFEAETTLGKIRLHDYAAGSWVVLVSHPKDFTPICTTEMASLAQLKLEFDKRGVKILGLSVDSVAEHLRWQEDIAEVAGTPVTYPLIGDHDLKIAKLYGMLAPGAVGTSSARTAADNVTVRNVFIIGPDKKIKLILAYPMNTGRNFDEILRVIDALQLSAAHALGTPANWRRGDEVVIIASVSDDAARQKYPEGWKTLKPYLRLVPDPSL